MTLYEAIKINASYLETLSKLGYKLGDERHLKMFEEYAEMIRRGVKVSYIVAYLAKRYGITERTVYNVVRRFGNSKNRSFRRP